MATNYINIYIVKKQDSSRQQQQQPYFYSHSQITGPNNTTLHTTNLIIFRLSNVAKMEINTVVANNRELTVFNGSFFWNFIHILHAYIQTWDRKRDSATATSPNLPSFSPKNLTLKPHGTGYRHRITKATSSQARTPNCSKFRLHWFLLPPSHPITSVINLFRAAEKVHHSANSKKPNFKFLQIIS